MITMNLQLFGGRGASSGTGSGKYRSVSEFEKAIGDDYDSKEYKEFADAYSEEADYNNGLKRNEIRSINEDGYTSHTDSVLNSEENLTKRELKSLNKAKKTPAELGTIEALKERLDIISDLRKLKGTKGRGRGNVDIV